MNIFEQTDYKKALRLVTEKRREQFGGRYTFEKIAEACGIQKTYLSRVLNGKGHLNPDQLFAACEFLKMTNVEIEFMELLRDFQISTNQHRAARLQRKLRVLQREHMKTQNVIQDTRTVDPERAWEYYSDFYLHLTHLFLTIPEYAADPKRICAALGFPEKDLEDYLLKLRNWGFVSEKGKRLEVKEPNQHLPEDSPAFKAFALLRRVKTLEKLTQRKKDNDYFLSVLFSARADYQLKLRRQILQLVKEAHGQIEKSEPEEVFQLNIDLFSWSSESSGG